MSDLIDRQAAIDAIHCNITVTGRQNAELVAATIGAFADRIKALPTVQPNHNADVSKMEIIHCKDCKYWKEKPLYTYCEKMYRMGILDVFDYATEENDFCSMAERRGDSE